jgi:hypothetical protein
MLALHLTQPARKRGMILVIALAFIVVLATLSVALAWVSSASLHQSVNLSGAARAQMAAESGMSLMSYLIREIRLPSDTRAETLMGSLYFELGMAMNESPLLGGGCVNMTGGAIYLPQIDLPRDAFSCRFTSGTHDGNFGCWLTVTGTAGAISRNVSLFLACNAKRSPVFDFGLASRGRIVINGNASLTGENDPSEACVLSTHSQPMAIEAGGHATIAGDLYVTGEDLSYVVLNGSGLTIGGSSDIATILDEHVFLGTEEPEFPEIDTAPLAALATTTIDANTDLSGFGGVFNNVRVKAGTNPSFGSNTVINGILFVEAPNKVVFTASATVNGMIVTEDGGDHELEDCQIDFRGHSTAPGTIALPDTEEFAAVKQQEGTFLLGPGFEVTFRGGTNTVNGVMAADQISFRGSTNIEGRFTGGIIGLKDRELTLQGNADIRVNLKDSASLPSGFKHKMALTPVSGSYIETIVPQPTSPP